MIGDVINNLLILTPTIIPVSALFASVISWNKKYLIFILFFIISGILNGVEKYIIRNISYFKDLGKRPDQCGYKSNNICTGCGAFPSTTTGESWGMPSGHSQSMAFATIYWIMYLYYTDKKIKTVDTRNRLIVGSILMILLSLFVMIQRIHSKCHSLLQVIVGSIFGIIYGIISYILSNKISNIDFPMN